MPSNRIKAVLRDVARGFTVNVFLLREDREPERLAEEFVDSFDEAEGLANRHAIRQGIPLRDVIVEET